MTLQEKIAFCTGADFWRTKELPRLGVPAIKMSDGPHGLRCQEGEADMIGVNKSLPATCFPTAVTAGATWNRELYAAEGEAIGKEALAAGVSVVLGPGCNIKRNPLGGRNFEYISEDPYQAGKMAAAFIRGQQSTGAASSLKHFAANSQEYKRMNGDSQLDQRTLREIYLTGFEIAVKEGKPGTVMCAYNKINGVHCSDSKELLTDILRSEWGFGGTVVTDWGALNDRIKGFQAGCDLNMPGGSDYMEQAAMEAVKAGALSEADVDASVERILRLVEKAQEAKASSVDWDAHHTMAQKVAEQGAVLLKNENGILPLCTSDVVLIGHMAREIRYQGSGSSHINPTKLVNLTDAMPDIPFVECCDTQGHATEYALLEAAEEAKAHQIAIVVAGLPESYESEAFDREDMKLPEGHNLMIEAVAAANPNTVVVLLGGSAMELPWADKVRAILYMGLPGQAGGQAMANLLTGKANPSGKLTETWPMTYEDVICKDTFGKRNVEYREGIYVGYRYYDKAKKAVRYPFGHGLSYTTFTYSDMKVDGRTVSVNITNSGAVKGAEVVQLYIAPPKDGLFRPEKELKGFARVELKPGETETVIFTLDDRSFAIWNDGWKIPGGTYTVQIGASSRDIRLWAEIKVAGEAVPAPAWQSGSWYETLNGQPGRSEWEGLMGHPVAFAPEPKKGQFTMDNSCMERTGFFESSNSLLNKFVENTVWSAKNNHADLPTDCPTRERHGWTGDAQIFFKTASYLFAYAPMAKKYLHDVFDWQEKSGRLPHIVPDGGADFYMRTMNGSVGWSDVGILIPERYAQMFADDSIAREFYDGMVSYARFMERRCGKTMPIFAERIRLPKDAKKYLVNSGQSYGEWAEPTEVSGGFDWKDFAAPHPEVSTAYTAHVLELMADIAQKLGHAEDAQEFRTYSDGCKKAYQALVRTEKYKLDTDRQAQLVRPLAFGLLNERQREFAKKRLIQALEHYGWRLGTGFLSTPLILDVLADIDLEAAYRLLENEEMPGWLFMPKNGATTIWESWEGTQAQGGIASLNHYSKGAVCEWLFKTMCGIQLSGENHFIIAPRPGGHFTYAKASYRSIFGTVEGGWKKENGTWIFDIAVPANCTAEIVLPETAPQTVSAGIYHFELH